MRILAVLVTFRCRPSLHISPPPSLGPVALPTTCYLVLDPLQLRIFRLVRSSPPSAPSTQCTHPCSVLVHVTPYPPDKLTGKRIAGVLGGCGERIRGESGGVNFEVLFPGKIAQNSGYERPSRIFLSLIKTLVMTYGAAHLNKKLTYILSTCQCSQQFAEPFQLIISQLSD